MKSGSVMAGLDDERYMAAALRLASRALGRAWPNPAVGCLIVGGATDGKVGGATDGKVGSATDGKYVVGQGWTQDGGRPHAEMVALSQAGDLARGATLYVTLEPCAHQGQTPPCVEAIISAGVRRVVSALIDPDPRVNGQGYERLRSAGVLLEHGFLSEAARRLNIGHVLRIGEGRPFVQLKLAHDRNGAIAGAGGRPVRITCDMANAYVHHMRAQADAVMIGSGTLRADNPRLTCRLPGAAALSPLRVVVDGDLSVSADPSLNVIRTAKETPTWIVTGPRSTGDDRTGLLESMGVRVLSVQNLEDGLDLSSVLRCLACEGIGRLLVEGGATLARSFLTYGLADEILLIEGKESAGKDGIQAFGTGGPELVCHDSRYDLVETLVLDQDRLRKYVKRI